MQLVAFLQLLDNYPFLAGVLPDRLVKVGVERFSQRLYRLQSLYLQAGPEFTLD